MTAQKSNEGVPGLVALFPSLIQLIAATTVGFSNQLKIGSFFYEPQLLILTNLITFLVSICVIALVSYLQETARVVVRTDKAQLKIIQFIKEKLFVKSDTSDSAKFLKQMNKEPLRRRNLLLLVFCLQLISIASFLFIVTLQINHTPETPFLMTAQHCSYVVFMSTAAGLIFLWVKTYLDKSKRFRPEELIPNFENALVKYGFLTRDINIFANIQTGIERRFGVKIGLKKYVFFISNDGSDIHYSFDVSALGDEQIVQLLNNNPSIKSASSATGNSAVHNPTT
ncbi:MAG: hypothetical protein WCS85_03270 [Candidatus Peribacteraceae bacterium]